MPDDQELLDLAASLRDDVQPTKADQVRGQLKAAETYNPDAYAKAMKAGAKKGVKPQVVLQDPKAFEDQPDLEALTVLSPQTADWILENFDNAVLGQDDIQNLKRFETASQRAKRLEAERISRANVGKAGRWTSPLYSLGAGLSTLLKVPSDIAYWGTSMAARIAGQQAPSRERFEGALLYTPLAGMALASKATGLSKEWYEQRERETPRFVVTDPKTGESFFNPKAISLDQAAQVLARELPSMAAMVGLEVATAGTATPAVAANVLQKMGRAGKALKYALRPSAGVEIARTIQGIHQDGIETLMAKGQTEEQAAANAAPGAALAGIASFTLGAPLQAKVLEDYFTRIATLKGGATLAAKGKTILKGIASQGIKEGTQETVQGFGEDLAKWASFHPDLSVREASENAVANFFGGFAMGGLMGGVGSAPASIRQAQQREFFQALADGAKDSKLLKRLPQKFQEAVQASVQDGPVEHVRISPEAYTTYFQSKNIDPVKMAETLGIQNLEEASVSGTDLLIPTGAYAAHLAATEHHAELSQDMRLGEDMMTPREAAAAEATKGQVEEVGQAVSLEVDQATQAGTEFQAIQEDLKARYIQAGETPAVAETYATDMAKVFYTLAQREGLNPQELMAQYAPKIVRGQAPMPEQVVAEAFTPETFPEEGVQWWEKDDLWFQGAYGEKPQKVETAPGMVQAPFRQTEFKGQLEDYQKTGQWYYNERRMVPLAAIEEKAPWDESRRVDAETRLKDTASTTPVLLATEDGGKTFKIQDGIHRINAARQQGFTAIPAEVQVVVSDRAPTEADFEGKDMLGGLAQTIDEVTGLPINEDGTVTVYHHTTKSKAEKIRKTQKLVSAGEPDVYFTTEPDALKTGYGDTSVSIRINPEKLELDDEFQDGRKDFRVDTGKPGGSIKVTLEPEGGPEPRQQFKGVDVESPEFKAWFGDSKVVDAEGKPLKVYHGTTVDEAFGEFKEKDFKEPSKQFLLDIGIHFSGSTDTASLYANPNKRRGDIGSGKSGVTPKVYPVYINIKNPLDLTSGIDSNVKEKLFREHSKFFKGGKSKVLFDVDPILLIQDLQRKMGRETLQTFIKGIGFDGVIYNWNQSDNYLVFEPTQIKSAISNTGAFSRTDPRILYQAAKPGPVFYSALSRAIPEIQKIADKEGKISPDQAKAWILARQKEGKFKKEEVESIGLIEFIESLSSDKPGEKIPWNDIRKYVVDNEIEFGEELLGEKWKIRTTAGDWSYFKTREEADDAYNAELEWIESYTAQIIDRSENEDYKYIEIVDGNNDVIWEAFEDEDGDWINKETEELIGDLDEALEAASAEQDEVWNYWKNEIRDPELGGESETVYEEYTVEGGENYKELLVTLKRGYKYKSSHWKFKNVLVHIRFDERTDTDGKKVLFINEIQSDWGQDYRKGKTEAKAPFVADTKSWVSLALKRALRYAADEGFDRIAFATGQQNADIYDLSQRVEKIYYRKNEDGKFYIEAYIDAETQQPLGDSIHSEDLADQVGENIASKMIAGEGAQEGEFKALSGEDLKVGGEGMRRFYDEIVPQTARALLKKLGGSLTKTTLEIEGEPVEHNAIDVTPQLAGTVQAGLPLFQSQKDDFSFGSKAWNEYYRSQVGSRARAKGDQAARAKKALEAAGTKRGQAEFDAEREAALRAEEEAFLRFDRAVEQIAKPRGWFTRAADGSFIIGKTPQGDFSTFIHEPAHAYLEMFKDLATREGASQRIQDDGAKVLAFLGVESWDQIGTIEHEKWARANEAYCREGKAPSDTLRGVFERFRVWLSMVYRQVTALDVELNDDIRGVFDRMRATDEEIELAHADIAGPRLFRTAEEAGMTEKDFQRYAREKDLEVEQAKGEILAKLNAAAVREKTKEWKEEAANVRAAIEQWVDAQPNFRAVAVLRAGKLEDGTPFTLKKDALVEQFGEDRTGALHKAHPGIYRVEGELDAETAAEILGFESGEALMAALEETPKRGEVIKSEVQRVMTERHGDIRYDGTLEDQAMQAIANDQRAKGLHKELESLKRKLENAPAQTKIQSLKDQIAKLEAEAKAQVKEKDEDAAFLAKQANALAETNEQLRARLEARDAKIQALKDQLAQAEAERKQETREDSAKRRAVRELPPIQSFRDEAKRLVDGKAIKDLQPQTYLNAMRTYGRKAWVADKKQDYQGAYDAKLKEILNQFLYLEAKKTLAESEKDFKYVKDLQKPSNVQAIAKAGGEEGQHVYWDQIQNILNEYQFIKVPNRNLRDTALFAAEHEQFGITFDVTQLPGAKNYRELTMPQITAVVDALKNIEHVAKNLGKVYQKLKKVDLEIEVKEASDSAYASHTGKLKPIPSMGEYQTWLQKLPRTVATWRAKIGKLDWWVDYLDGGNINGAWRRNTLAPINEAAARKNQAGKLVHQKIRELYAAMPKNFRDNLWRDTGIQFPNRERPLNEGQLICWFLNLGTEENRLKATLGEGLMDGMGVMNPVYDQALAGLTLQQCQFVQGLWDTLGLMLPDIKAKHLRETGLELKLKKVTPFQVKTKDGKAFTFQGGYWPLKADSWLSQVGELQEMMGIPTLGTIARPTTNKSHTKAVTNATYALNLDIGANLTQHIDDVLTDTYCAEAMNDVFKFLRQPGIKKSIQQTMGAEYYQEFLSWLLDFSNSNKTVDQGDAFLVAPLMRFKSAFVVSKLALNFSSNAMQLLDPIKVLLDKDMKVLSYAKGFASVMLNRKLFAEVQELSPNVMRFRAENWNRELHELANYRGKFNSKLAAFQQAAMITFTLMDKLNTTTAWYGRYIQGLEETNGDVDQAIALADRIVDRSFQAGAPHHMSRLMRTKGWTNLFTTFGGDISTWFGIMDNAIRTGDPKRMVVVLMGLFIEQILAQIIRNRMPTEDEDEIEWLLLQAGHSVFGKIPFIGDMVEIGMAKLEDRVPQFGNPVFDAGEKALMSPFRAYDAYAKQEDAEKASMEMVDALGTTLGVPGTAQGLKSWRYFKDVREGRRPEPEGPGQATYEAILPPKKER